LIHSTVTLDLAQVPPTKLARKHNLASGGVRDYHWTAALVFRMLHKPNEASGVLDP
jgi:hypothetical protein